MSKLTRSLCLQGIQPDEIKPKAAEHWDNEIQHITSLEQISLVRLAQPFALDKLTLTDIKKSLLDLGNYTYPQYNEKVFYHHNADDLKYETQN